MQGIRTQPRHILTFDLEEHFHASRFDSPMRRRGWSSFQSRVQSNVEQILELLAHHSTKATFFALGWLAEQHPSVIRMVSAAGHEIACLGYGHELVAAQTPQSFRQDIHRAKCILEDITGHQVVGFRAPSLSITAHTPWALPIVAEEGFLYDSSVLPIVHDLAGIPGANRWIHRLAWEERSLWEIPTLHLECWRISYCHRRRRVPSSSQLSGVEIPSFTNRSPRQTDRRLCAVVGDRCRAAAHARHTAFRVPSLLKSRQDGRPASPATCGFSVRAGLRGRAPNSRAGPSTSAHAVPDSVTGDHLNGFPQLTTV